MEAWAAAGGAFWPRWTHRNDALDARLQHIGRCAIALLIVALHVLLAIPLQRLLFGRPPSGEREQAMQLVYVSWLPRAQGPPAAPAKATARSTVDAGRRAGRPVAAAASAAAESTAPAAAPLALSRAADDRWTLDAGPRPAQASSAQVFRRRNPVPRPPPERFPMVDRSPAAVVRRIAMDLFWPAGYSDDPCAGLNEAIDAFSQRATNERDRRLLADALLQRSRYCPP